MRWASGRFRFRKQWAPKARRPYADYVPWLQWRLCDETRGWAGVFKSWNQPQMYAPLPQGSSSSQNRAPH